MAGSISHLSQTVPINTPAFTPHLYNEWWQVEGGCGGVTGGSEEGGSVVPASRHSALHSLTDSSTYTGTIRSLPV
ncbi:hypothetical protein E2C01_009943 [Portunus trituberculatus]|uniref:Uncharacterized protein n=1 Tax=Portunus trituberculatus TaxID=210409 RepID=A0A5B7D7C3_PORTR|nr:hypothetical protein [Portunus trituberculatus]